MRALGRSLLVVAVAAALLAVGAGAALLLAPADEGPGAEDSGPQGEGPEGAPPGAKASEGGYAEYEVTGEVLFIPLDGELRVDVRPRGDDTFDVLLTPTGLPGVDPMSRTAPMEDGYINGTWAIIEEYLGGRGELVGQEELDTVLGPRSTLHYRNDSDDNVTDFYIDRRTGMPLLIERRSSAIEVRAELAAVDLPGLRAP